MTDPVYQPFEGDISTYGSGPEHQFFLWDTAASTLPDAAGDVPTPTPRPAGISGWRPNDDRDGSNFGAGAVGERARDVEMMGRGRAPFTGRGIATAIGNTFGALRGAVSPMGLAGLGMTATGTRPGGIAGQLLGGGIRDIPGHTPYDRDLVDAVGAGRMTRAAADHEQERRNDVRGALRSADPVRGFGGGPAGGARRTGAGGGNRGGGGGGVSDGGTQNTGAGGQRRAYADGGIAGVVDSPTPGRSDEIETEAEEGSYVVPADVLSAIGEGNTDAGRALLDKAVQALMQRAGGEPGMARGGRVPIQVSGGEYIIPPQAVAAHGAGSHRHGANKLDALVKEIRQRTAKKLRKLPAPRR